MNAQQVAKFYDKFYFNENIIFPILSWAQKYKIKLFFTYFKSCKILGVTVTMWYMHRP